MCSIVTSSITDKIINHHLKNYIKKANISEAQLTQLLQEKLSRADIKKIKNGTYIFNISEFLYVASRLNFNIETIFDEVENSKLLF